MAKGIAAAILVGWALAASAPADELDELVKAGKPPARFADYTPDFRAEKLTYRWWDYPKLPDGTRGPLKRCSGQKLALLDGKRIIGYMATYRGAWREIVMHTMSPAIDPGVDPDDWDLHYMRNFGDCLPMIVAGYGEDAAADKQVTKVEGGGRTLTFLRDYAWTADADHPGRDERALSAVTLRVHPQLGYVLEQRVEWRAKLLPLHGRKDETPKPIEALPGGMFFGYGVVSPWPDSHAYRQAFFTPGKTYRQGRDGKQPFADVKYCMYWGNGLSVEAVRHGYHPVVRPGGMVGYMDGREGWGVALTAVESDRDLRYAVCPAWAEFHTAGPYVPQTPDKDGLFRLTYTRRMVGLPPEVQDHIRNSAQVLFADHRALMIRLDGEDFEDQPLSYANPYRGMRFVGRFVQVTDERARSGKKSIVMAALKPADMARVWDRLYNEHPQARFDLSTTYRLECWAFVEGDETEAFVIAHRDGPKDGSVYLKPESVGRSRTGSARSGEGWKKLSLEFTTNARGGVLFLGFAALGPGRAFFDDFSLRRVAPPKGAPAPAGPPAAE